MDRRVAVDLLAPAHARAIRLQEDGGDDALIASELGIEPVAVRPLLRVAAAKLANLLVQPDPEENG